MPSSGPVVDVVSISAVKLSARRVVSAVCPFGIDFCWCKCCFSEVDVGKLKVVQFRASSRCVIDYLVGFMQHFVELPFAFSPLPSRISCAQSVQELVFSTDCSLHLFQLLLL